LPDGLVRKMALPASTAITGTLADSSLRLLETHSCEVRWFGRWIGVEAIVSVGNDALLGVALLGGCDLRINYCTSKVTVSAS